MRDWRGWDGRGWDGMGRVCGMEWGWNGIGQGRVWWGMGWGWTMGVMQGSHRDESLLYAIILRSHRSQSFQ